MYKLNIIETLPEFDHDVVLVYDENKQKHTGKGYLGKESKKLGLERCPECEIENYTAMVSSGICYNCHFDINTLE